MCIRSVVSKEFVSHRVLAGLLICVPGLITTHLSMVFLCRPRYVAAAKDRNSVSLLVDYETFDRVYSARALHHYGSGAVLGLLLEFKHYGDSAIPDLPLFWFSATTATGQLGMTVVPPSSPSGLSMSVLRFLDR